MKIIAAFDSMKGSLTAAEAVAAVREGVLTAHPDSLVVSLPLADGGEGSAEALCRYTSATWVDCPVHDPLMRPITARYGVSDDGNTAIMEMATAAGLTLLSEQERNPMRATTFGVGEMIADAVRRGCRKILIGVGGSATNDGGIGMLTALGVRFVDGEGNTIAPMGANLRLIANIGWSGLIPLDGVSIEVICDVRNPLYGIDGAACVYAPQKGATPQQVVALDEGLRHFAILCDVDPDTPGAGAAGGLGYGLLLLGGKLRPGAEVILDMSGIDEHLAGADLVITGEGKIDRQTLCGKLPFAVLQRARRHHVPVIALAGRVEDESLLLQAGFTAVTSINSPSIPLAAALNPATAYASLRTTASNQNFYKF